MYPNGVEQLEHAAPFSHWLPSHNTTNVDFTTGLTTSSTGPPVAMFLIKKVP